MDVIKQSATILGIHVAVDALELKNIALRFVLQIRSGLRHGLEIFQLVGIAFRIKRNEQSEIAQMRQRISDARSEFGLFVNEAFACQLVQGTVNCEATDLILAGEFNLVGQPTACGIATVEDGIADFAHKVILKRFFSLAGRRGGDWIQD